MGNTNFLGAIAGFMKGRADSQNQKYERERQTAADKRANESFGLQKQMNEIQLKGLQQKMTADEAEAAQNAMFNPIVNQIVASIIPNPGYQPMGQPGAPSAARPEIYDSRSSSMAPQQPGGGGIGGQGASGGMGQPSGPDFSKLTVEQLAVLQAVGPPALKNMLAARTAGIAEQSLAARQQHNKVLESQGWTRIGQTDREFGRDTNRVVLNEEMIPGGGVVQIPRNYYTQQPVGPGAAPTPTISYGGGMGGGGGGQPQAQAPQGQPGQQPAGGGGMAIPQFQQKGAQDQQGQPIYKTLPKSQTIVPDETALKMRNPQGKVAPIGQTYDWYEKNGYSPYNSAMETQRISLMGTMSILNKLSDIVYDENGIFTAEDGMDRIKQMPEVWAAVKGQFGEKATVSNIYQSLKEGVLANLVRTFGERGTLTDNDIGRARALFAAYYPIPDTREVAVAKMQMLEELVADINGRIVSGNPSEDLEIWEKGVSSGKRGVLYGEEKKSLEKQIQERVKMNREQGKPSKNNGQADYTYNPATGQLE